MATVRIAAIANLRTARRDARGEFLCACLPGGRGGRGGPLRNDGPSGTSGGILLADLRVVPRGTTRAGARVGVEPGGGRPWRAAGEPLTRPPDLRPEPPCQ